MVSKPYITSVQYMLIKEKEKNVIKITFRKYNNLQGKRNYIEGF